jgi:predicted transcriptional regulator
MIKNSCFYDKRFENFEKKLLRTNIWLENKKFKKAGQIRGIDYYIIEKTEDEYDEMHKKSLINL